MSKNLKTLVCCILALVFVAGTVVAVFADSAAVNNVELASDEVTTEVASDETTTVADEATTESVSDEETTVPDEVDSETEPVSVTETYLLGDVNLDGVITAADARLALRASATLEVLSDVQSILADVIKNNVIKADDARAILRVAAALDHPFGTVEI